MILRPNWLEQRTPRRADVPRTVAPDASLMHAPSAEITPLLPIESAAVRDLLDRGETVRAATRGSDGDEVYLWLVTERRLLHLVHARWQVSLYREMPLRDLRRLHLIVVREGATLEVTSRQRTYRLERLSRRNALAFAHQLGVDDVLITERFGTRGNGGA